LLDSDLAASAEWFSVPEGTVERIASTANRIRNANRLLQHRSRPNKWSGPNWVTGRRRLAAHTGTT